MKKYLLQISKVGVEPIGVRHQKDVFLDDEFVPLNELKPGLTMLLWKIVYKDQLSTEISDISNYVPYEGEIKFKD